MAKIRDILQFKKRKENEPISFEDHLERATERQRKPETRKPWQSAS
ncbi:hypothetical protein [Brevibacillus parabrevis]|uniref:Uncharacterized protein n=1 Tax=Brevibacillus parabrevis TaxID=54914 RepID=A0A4Y3PV05_BREPA|nr:hypothetical protein [Brevibacillus parabrevis]GEB35886.1 hypothetical protein BPA01_54660 [Brevibacillus parabrevis]